MKKLKDRVLEIVAIAQECPDNLQQICFETLLKHALYPQETRTPAVAADAGKKKDEPDISKQEIKSVVEEAGKTQDDLSEADLHVKVRRFLTKYKLSVANLNELFYKEGDQILPLYEDLKTTRTSESQLRITLLQCLLNALPTGDFQTTVEEARQEATVRKCYDSANWATYYKNSKSLFDFDKYSRSLKTIGLSEQGKGELANVILELQ